MTPFMLAKVSQRRPGWALIAILGLALSLRVVNLEGRSLWYDEAFAVLFADQGLDRMLYGTLTPVAGGAADIHPLLYYLTLDGWMTVAGRSPTAVRLLSVFVGVATVGVIYLIGRDLFNARTGLAAALMTAIAPFHVQYSQEARMYALLGLLLAAATWCVIRGIRSFGQSGQGFLSRWGGWIAFGILAALAMYTQQLAAFYLVALGLLPLILRRPRAMMGVVISAALALLLYLPWLVQLPAQWSKVGAYYWIPIPNAARLLLTVRTFFTAAIDLPMPVGFYALVGALILLVFLLLQAVLTLRHRQSDHRPLAAVLWLALAPVILMWLVSQVRPVYLDRALLPSALLLYLALGWLFTRGGLPRPIAVFLGTVSLMVAVVGLYYHYTWATFPNSPFRDATRVIAADMQPGDLVVHQSKLSALPMIYYDPNVPQVVIADAPGSPEDTLAPPTREVLGVEAVGCVQLIGARADRVWYVTFSSLLAQSEAAGRTDVRTTVDWLTTHYTLQARHTVHDLDVLLFANPDSVASSGADCDAT